MTPDERRAQLRRMLNALPMERDAYLHEGRAMTRPPVDDLVDKIEALFADDTASLFQQVMTASERYVTRFGGELTREGTQRKVDEEIAEFKEASEDLLFDQNQVKILSLHDLMHPSQFWENNAAQELIDCLVTLGGMASFLKLKWPLIEQAARDTLDKLDKRTTETHTWDEKSQTVMKRSKLETNHE